MLLRVLLVLAAQLFAVQSAHTAEIWHEPGSGMAFVRIPKGCFKMGLPANAFGEIEGNFKKRIQEEMPEHEVCLDAFWIGRFEVREAEWHRVMGEGDAAERGNVPVAGVTWEQATEFAQRLSALTGGKEHFRLPTEAEWEYACRAGAPAVTQEQYFSDLDHKAWYSSPYGSEDGIQVTRAQAVGLKAANAFGLYDMLGNVWEWTQDSYLSDAYTQHALYNPRLDDMGGKRVIRGGGTHTARQLIRCESRAWLPQAEVHGTVGLRLVRIQEKE